MVNKGHNLYQKHCGACHGSEGQGAPNWQQVGPDGNYPPPPLNGTGHAWHHPRAALVRTIKHGTIAIGGKMPGWDDKLSDEDIASVIAWFQSRWPDELYQAWARMDQQSRQK
jgi:mono/diheme cytochrome c family protein